VEGRRIKRESGGMSEYDQSTSYSCMKVEKWNPFKLFKRGGKEGWERVIEGVNLYIYACMEISQLNLF
jgi:hypothetical protein